MLNGGLIVLTVIILAILTYFFIFEYLYEKTQDVLFTSFNKAYGFQFVGACYLNFVVIAMWALARTYSVGPGFTKDIFKSVKIENLMLGGASERSSTERQSQDAEIGRRHSARSS